MQDLYSTKAHHIFLYHTEFFFSEQNVMSQMMSLLNKILYVLHLSWPVTLMESSKIGKKKTKNIITAECTLTGDHCKYRCTNIRLAIFFFLIVSHALSPLVEELKMPLCISMQVKVLSNPCTKQIDCEDHLKTGCSDWVMWMS